MFTRKILFLCVMSVLLLPNLSIGQDLRESLFEEADKVMASAREVRADLLAPQGYGEAVKYYQRADENLKRKKDIEVIQKDLQKTVAYLKKAIETSGLAEVMFAEAVQARADAVEVEAGINSPRLWKQAEDKFEKAAIALEEGDSGKAKERGVEAESLYRNAELDAIKTAFVNETRILLARADEQKVEKYAPKTLQQAKDLLRQAEKAIEKKRYDTDKPRNQAKEAKYNAQHAIYLASLIRSTGDEISNIEGLLLDAEEKIARIATSLDIVPEFDSGTEKTTKAVIERIDRTLREQHDLLLERSELKQQIAGLEERLGGISEERLAMETRLKDNAEIREKYSKIENIFSSKEAIMLRKENHVILRLIGLNFESGNAVIQPSHFALLTKVQDAIQVFPDSKVRIEGHTDSYGTDSKNMDLSRERADAVRQYLLANMRLHPESVESVGYGESRPIANNETKEGRTKNRRIDVVIFPKF